MFQYHKGIKNYQYEDKVQQNVLIWGHTPQQQDKYP